jgi:hypothetical protein
MSEFHKTLMGQKYYNNDLPALIKSITRLCEAMEAQNDINEKLLKESKKNHNLKLKEINERSHPEL